LTGKLDRDMLGLAIRPARSTCPFDLLGRAGMPRHPEERPMPETPLLEVTDLKTHFVAGNRIGRAVDGISFQVARGETLGIVGESGSGKSITALSILRLVPKPYARIVDGSIRFDGIDLVQLSEKAMRGYRGRRISMVLQDPLTALNPVLKIGDQIGEAIALHTELSAAQIRERAVALLRQLRVPAAAERLNSYPHQFSGGMRQRVVGAIALACDPDLLIADEPTTALDATVQDRYLRLLKSIQRQRRLSIIFITHDFAIVARMCDRVAVMYAGRVVETAATRALFAQPRHPYTQALMRSVPQLDADPSVRLPSIEGTPPSIFEPRVGCPFAPRCPQVMARCRSEYPPASTFDTGHSAACWRLVQ
jgi:peptide/nickel transport system ATP-binding protein